MTDRPFRLGSRSLTLAGVGSLVLASVGLFVVSRGKWSDAIIDSGREWIVPDALARGEVLYRDVVYWFGPFTPYLHAAFFQVFGSSFGTLALAGVAGSLGILTALFLALRTVTGRREAALWTSLAVPALVFMPNAGGSILGMGFRIWHAAAFALLAIAVASGRTPGRIERVAAVGAGALSALAGLCRTEWGILSAAAVFLTLALRSPSRAQTLRNCFRAAAAFLLVFGGTLGAFLVAAGPKAVLDQGQLLLLGVPAETRAFLIEFSGIRDWRNGVLALVYSTGAWLGVVLVLQILSFGAENRGRLRRKLAVLVGVLLLLALCATLGGADGFVLASAAPFFCGLALYVGVFGRRRNAALAGFGLAGFLSFYRRPFHIGDAAYVGGPLLFAFVCAAGLLQALFEAEESMRVRERLRAHSSAVLLLLVALAFAVRAGQYRSDERIPIPGTGGYLSARPEVAARLEQLSDEIRRQSRAGEGLVVFPEGEVVNYLAGRPNPIRHKLYIPGYLTDSNEEEVLDELRRSPPRTILVLSRPTSEYGPRVFGIGYGTRIRRWMEEHYDIRPFDASDAVRARSGGWTGIAVRHR